MVPLDGSDYSIYLDQGQSLLHNTLCLFPAKDQTELVYSIIHGSGNGIERPIDFYAKLISTPEQDQISKGAIIERVMRKEKEGLTRPKEKRAAGTKKSAAATKSAGVAKRAIRKPNKK